MNQVQPKVQSSPSDVAQEIDEAMLNNEFFMVYQPQLDSSSGRLSGFEALIRWRHPLRGLISPVLFIPLAEDSGRIVELGKWLLDRACADLRDMHIAQNSDDLRIAVNLSPIQLKDPQIFPFIMQTLAKHQLSARHLHLELTETALLSKCHGSVAVVGALHRAGIEVWIDDFGTGYTSISMLRDYAISGIKIDRSFVSGICSLNDDSDFCLVSALIALGQRLRLKVVAEGVETKEQLQVLQQLGCDTLQGFLIGKPASVQQVIENW